MVDRGEVGVAGGDKGEGETVVWVVWGVGLGSSFVPTAAFSAELWTMSSTLAVLLAKASRNALFSRSKASNFCWHVVLSNSNCVFSACKDWHVLSKDNNCPRT